MKKYRLETTPAVELEVEAAFEWYEREQTGLGFEIFHRHIPWTRRVAEFLNELRAAYQRVVDHPLAYQVLRTGIRRALTRRFPYAIYYSIEGEVLVILAVLHTARDPAEWQRRV